MKLFSINGVDFTSFIKVPTYKVNRKDIYEEWTDANHVSHRKRTRGQIEGTLTLLFNEKSDLFNFLNTVNTNKDSGGCYIAPVSLYINNENTVVDNLEVFIEMDLPNNLPILNLSENNGFEIGITER